LKAVPGVLYNKVWGDSMAKFRPPDVVVKTIEEHKREGEWYEVTPCRFYVDGNSYYSVSYHFGNTVTGYIEIKEDGSVPPIQEIEKVSRMSHYLSNIHRALYSTAIRVARKRHLGFMRRSLSILRWVERTMKQEMPPDIQQALEGFIKAPQTTIENHLRLKELVNNVDKEIKNIVKNGFVTTEIMDDLINQHYELWKCAAMQNYVQMNTYEDRKKLIQYLFQKKKIFPAITLWFYHLRMHPDKEKVKPKDREIMEDVLKVFIEGDMEREERMFQKALEITRNPR